MFARSVTVRLKPTQLRFQQNHGERHLPLLQKQKGFRERNNLVASKWIGSSWISLWIKKDGRRSIQPPTYPEVQKLLEKVSEGTPQVQTYEVGTSTIHKTRTGAGV